MIDLFTTEKLFKKDKNIVIARYEAISKLCRTALHDRFACVEIASYLAMAVCC